MKILTFLGTRPEIIRLSQVIPLLDRHTKHVLVHTGQNYEQRLSDIFFAELGVRPPDHYLGAQGESFGAQVSHILSKADTVLRQEKPDGVLILGDTNSGLPAMLAARMGISVFHMEAGNRCYDDRVPEEVNRRIIDHCSTILMPYTNRSRENLLREGIAPNRVFVTGNPILEVINAYKGRTAASGVLSELKVESKGYFLVTMHRSENVDSEVRFTNYMNALNQIADKWKLPVICSLHPRTKSKMEQFGFNHKQAKVRFLPPFGFVDFLTLEQNAYCVLTDSGTVQEECCILEAPNVTLRDVTERPETIESGSNIVSGNDPEKILECVDVAVNNSGKWSPPPEYMVPHVAPTIVRIVMGYFHRAG